MELTKSSITPPNWQMVTSVDQLCTGWVVNIYDKTLDTEIDFHLDSTGTLSVGELVYPKKITTIEELDEAISDYSDQIRGHSETFKEPE
jgi:hypothetical protein